VGFQNVELSISLNMLLASFLTGAKICHSTSRQCCLVW